MQEILQSDVLSAATILVRKTPNMAAKVHSCSNCLRFSSVIKPAEFNHCMVCVDRLCDCDGHHRPPTRLAWGILFKGKRLKGNRTNCSHNLSRHANTYVFLRIKCNNK